MSDKVVLNTTDFIKQAEERNAEIAKRNKQMEGHVPWYWWVIMFIIMYWWLIDAAIRVFSNPN